MKGGTFENTGICPNPGKAPRSLEIATFCMDKINERHTYEIFWSETDDKIWRDAQKEYNETRKLPPNISFWKSTPDNTGFWYDLKKYLRGKEITLADDWSFGNVKLQSGEDILDRPADFIYDFKNMWNIFIGYNNNAGCRHSAGVATPTVCYGDDAPDKCKLILNVLSTEFKEQGIDIDRKAIFKYFEVAKSRLAEAKKEAEAAAAEEQDDAKEVAEAAAEDAKKQILDELKNVIKNKLNNEQDNDTKDEKTLEKNTIEELLAVKNVGEVDPIMQKLTERIIKRYNVQKSMGGGGGGVSDDSVEDDFNCTGKNDICLPLIPEPRPGNGAFRRFKLPIKRAEDEITWMVDENILEKGISKDKNQSLMELVKGMNQTITEGKETFFDQAIGDYTVTIELKHGRLMFLHHEKIVNKFGVKYDNTNANWLVAYGKGLAVDELDEAKTWAKTFNDKREDLLNTSAPVSMSSATAMDFGDVEMDFGNVEYKDKNMDCKYIINVVNGKLNKEDCDKEDCDKEDCDVWEDVSNQKILERYLNVKYSWGRWRLADNRGWSGYLEKLKKAMKEQNENVIIYEGHEYYKFKINKSNGKLVEVTTNPFARLGIVYNEGRWAYAGQDKQIDETATALNKAKLGEEGERFSFVFKDKAAPWHTFRISKETGKVEDYKFNALYGLRPSESDSTFTVTVVVFTILLAIMILLTIGTAGAAGAAGAVGAAAVT